MIKPDNNSKVTEFPTLKSIGGKPVSKEEGSSSKAPEKADDKASGKAEGSAGGKAEDKAGGNKAPKDADYVSAITREAALELLKEYNKEPFHIQHALTVEGVMRYYAKQKGYNEDFWGIVGLLHDIDFELYPEEHCVKAPELLKKGGVSEEMIRAIICHGYGLTGVDVAPQHEMEKILYATDELTGLIWACALMRPSKSTKDLELKSLKKKYKDKKFAAGCSRDVIEKGAAMLGMELDELLSETILAMRSCEN